MALNQCSIAAIFYLVGRTFAWSTVCHTVSQQVRPMDKVSIWFGKWSVSVEIWNQSAMQTLFVQACVEGCHRECNGAA